MTPRPAAKMTVTCLLALSSLATAHSNFEASESSGARSMVANIEREEMRLKGRTLTADAATYSYGELDGYKSWGGDCQRKDAPQSPIDIPADVLKAAYKKPTNALRFNYTVFEGAVAISTPYGPQVNMPKGNFLTVGGVNWMLTNFHFHSPSENVLGGRHGDMDMHMVHMNPDTGDLAAVGLLLNAVDSECAGASSALAQALANEPKGAKNESAPFTLDNNTFEKAFAPAGSLSSARRKPIVTFTGSVTVPPCKLNVKWFVFARTSVVNALQVLKYQRSLKKGATLSMSNRPVQPLLNRTITPA